MVRQTKIFLTGFPVGGNRFYALVALLAIVAVVSCSKSPQPTTRISTKEDAPLMSARNITVFFSDSGRVEAELQGPLLNRYGGESPRIELPEGFRISMFDENRQVSTTITGQRGLRWENDQLMEAFGNVVVRNELKNEQLETEHLVWDERRHLIRTDEKVKIIRPDQVLTGTGLESNESFTRYSIRNPEGAMAVAGDSL